MRYGCRTVSGQYNQSEGLILGGAVGEPCRHDCEAAWSGSLIVDSSALLWLWGEPWHAGAHTRVRECLCSLVITGQGAGGSQKWLHSSRPLVGIVLPLPVPRLRCARPGGSSTHCSLSGAGGLPQVRPASGGLGRSSQAGELRAECGRVSDVAAGAVIPPLWGHFLCFGGEGMLPLRCLWERFPWHCWSKGASFRMGFCLMEKQILMAGYSLSVFMFQGLFWLDFCSFLLSL